MKRIMKSLLLVIPALIGAWMIGNATIAQEPFSEDTVIAMVAEDPLFAKGLENYPGWWALAFDSGNRYGIWQVEFYDADGNDLGWANVSPLNGRIYSWESYLSVDDKTREEAYPIVRDFVVNSPEVLSLLEAPDQYEIYIDYEPWSKVWGAYINVGGVDSIWVAVDYDDDFNFINPRIAQIHFEGVDSYEEWFAANEDRAKSIAFEDAVVMEAVRGVVGWTSTVSRSEDQDNVWIVTFEAAGETLITVHIDLNSETVIEIITEE
ncbi:MAG: hypothetical protein MUF87_09315 [Anaerolineae bacterium]|jgi:hypothetical protein|nr:hypothetical protein [Anaerolineae bacterium]